MVDGCTPSSESGARLWGVLDWLLGCARCSCWLPAWTRPGKGGWECLHWFFFRAGAATLRKALPARCAGSSYERTGGPIGRLPPLIGQSSGATRARAEPGEAGIGSQFPGFSFKINKIWNAAPWAPSRQSRRFVRIEEFHRSLTFFVSGVHFVRRDRNASNSAPHTAHHLVTLHPEATSPLPEHFHPILPTRVQSVAAAPGTPIPSAVSGPHFRRARVGCAWLASRDPARLEMQFLASSEKCISCGGDKWMDFAASLVCRRHLGCCRWGILLRWCRVDVCD